MFNIGYGQGGDPCSINAGSDQIICYSDQSFTLNGVIGSNIDPNSTTWVSNSPSLSVLNPNSLNSAVNVNNPVPQLYVISLFANCVDEDGSITSIRDDITITVLGDPTPASISVNGDYSPGLTFCNNAQAVGNHQLQDGETGRWKVISSSKSISIASPNFYTLDLSSAAENPCPSAILCYEVSNGSCVSRDTVEITFIGQDSNVNALSIYKKEYGMGSRFGKESDLRGDEPAAICYNTRGHYYKKDVGKVCDSLIYEQLDSNLTLSGTRIGCGGNFNFRLLNSNDFGQQPQLISKSSSEIRAYQEFKYFESGCYEYEYFVGSSSGICPTGRDTFQVFIQLDTVTLFGIDKSFSFCESFPDTFEFEHPRAMGKTGYSEWFISRDQGARPTIICDDINDSLQLCKVTDFDPQTTSIRLRQFYYIVGCDTTGTVVCDMRDVDLSLVFTEIDEDTVFLSNACGAIFNFNPWSEVTSRAKGLITFIAGPTYTKGRRYASETLFNLETEGRYVFELMNDTIQNSCQSSYCVGDLATVIVDICEAELPSAGTVNSLCLDSIVQLVGTSSLKTCSQPLWTQLSGPPIQFVNGTSENDAQPFIQVSSLGDEICLEYTFSTNDDCYLADTTCFDVVECETPCIEAEIVEVICYNHDNSDPNDDYWSFKILVTDNSGQGSYWGTSGDVSTNGSYGTVKNIYTSGTILTNPSVSFRVFDVQNPECYVDLVVTAPPTCSEDCDMVVDPPIIQCVDIDDKKYYTVNLTVTVPGNDCYFVKRKNPDGSEFILGSYTGTQTISYGPYTPGEEFTIWVMSCNNYSCVIDFYVRAPEDCGYCLDYEVTNVKCYDSGTSNPDDDYWSFDLWATGGPGTYWTATSPINTSSAYGLYKTIWRGAISQNPVADFEIYDNQDPECNAFVKVDAPPTCSANCDLMIFPSISNCDTVDGVETFNVFLDVQTTLEDCYSVSKKNLDGSKEDLGTFSASQIQLLGPFDASEGFTLWVMLCEHPNCVADAFISAPDCSGGSQGASSVIELNQIQASVHPIPTSSELYIEIDDFRSPTVYSIYTISGQKLISGAVKGASEKVNVQGLSTGTYYIKLENEEKKTTVLKFEKVN